MTLPAVAPRAHQRTRSAVPDLRRLGPAVLGVLATVAAAAFRPHRASLARLWEMPMTVIGLGFADFAAFHLAHGWGWLATGASLVAVELLIADTD